MYVHCTEGAGAVQGVLLLLHVVQGVTPAGTGGPPAPTCRPGGVPAGTGGPTAPTCRPGGVPAGTGGPTAPTCCPGGGTPAALTVIYRGIYMIIHIQHTPQTN